MHLTLGVDSLVWGLTYAHLRSTALRRAGMKDKLPLLTKLPAEKYWALQVLCLPKTLPHQVPVF